MNEYKLGDLIKIKNGKDYKRIDKGTIPLYGSGGIMGYVSNYLYDGESILLPRKGTLNNIKYVNGKFWTIDTMYWTLINNNNAYAKYLYLYLSILDVSSKDSGSTLPSMTFNSYYSITVKLPKYNIQKKIGDFLFLLIQKIDINNKIIKELENIAKTIYDYWFMQFEFPDQNGNPYKSSGGKMVYNEMFKNNIPKNWKIKKFKDIAKMYQPETIPISKLNENGKYVVYGANGIIGKYDKYNHKQNEIAICCRGAGCGQYLMTLPYSWITGNAMIIKPKDNYNYKEYIYYKLSDKEIFNYITGSAQPQITRTNIENMKILIPNKLTLEKFNKITVNIRNKIINCLQENQELNNLKNYLLPLLMNGQIVFKEKK